MPDLDKLRRERAEAITEARAISDKEEPTAEEEAKFDELMKRSDEIEAKIKRAERVAAAEERADKDLESRAAREDISPDEAGDRSRAEMAAFNSYLHGGMAALNEEQRAAMASRRQELPQAAMGVGTDADGGYLVPDEFRRQIDEALLAYGGMREVATIVRSTSGAPLQWPTSNQTAVKGRRIAENTTTNPTTPQFGSMSIGAHMYTSDAVRCSLQLLQDSAFNVETWLRNELAERIGRITNEEFTTGTGGGAMPAGIVPGSAEGFVAAAVADVETDELIEVEHSVDPAYRVGSRWMFHDVVLKTLRKKKDANGQYVWQPGLEAGAKNTVLGYSYTINQDMAVPAANAESVLFGRLNKYLIRDVLGFQLLRLTERFADFLQIGFIGYSRHDGALQDAGTNPVKHLKQAAA